jgi:hypothetical protein
MHVLIAEKNLNGRRMLNRTLKIAGFEVSVAESGSHAMNLLKAVRPNIVLLNVFQCMHSSDTAPAGKISYDEDSTSLLLVTCSKGGENLAEFMSHNNPHCNVTFDLMPARMKSGIMHKIQQLCAALRLCGRFSSPEAGFDWQRFNRLMDWTLTQEMLPDIQSMPAPATRDDIGEIMTAMRKKNWKGIPVRGKANTIQIE